jgi:hypothetical protein
MSGNRDYSCEIMSLIVLTVLSALSHFWYIMIAICIVIALAGAGLLISILLIRLRRRLLARLLDSPLGPASSKNARPRADVSVNISQGTRPSIPVA